MGDEKKDFRYADREAQIQRTNRFMVVGYIIYYLMALLIVWISGVRGFHSYLYCVILTVTMAISWVIPMILYMRNKKSPKVKYYAFAGLMLSSFFLAWAFNGYYVRFMAALPLVGCILFFDKKFAAITSVLFTILNFSSFRLVKNVFPPTVMELPSAIYISGGALTI